MRRDIMDDREDPTGRRAMIKQLLGIVIIGLAWPELLLKTWHHNSEDRSANPIQMVAVMKTYSLTKGERETHSEGELFGNNLGNVTQMCPTNEKGLHPNWRKPLKSLVAGSGFEPETFGL